MVLKKTRQIGRALDFPLQFIEENIYFSISEQCQWYDISRNSYYYAPVEKDCTRENYLKELINKQYEIDITQGSRRISAELNKQGVGTSRCEIMRLMNSLNIYGVVPKKN